MAVGSQLSHVRASNLRELVYKQGQAGVTKASVTVVFDNSNPQTSPIGYEQYNELTITRQVVVNGKNKYLINGHTAQLNRVQNLFQSVQLNIANPTFLVMQGRITKVLNMKPPEILGLIEEAAGTRMYETKKTAACNTINKKQLKVTEINTLLAEEITPQLEKLRRECALFMKWSANGSEIQRLEKRAAAYRFFEADQSLNSSNKQESALQDSLAELQLKHQRVLEKIASAEQDMLDAEQNVSADARLRIDQLQELVTAESKRIVKSTSALENVEATVDEETSARESAQVALTKATQLHDAQRTALQRILAQRDQLDAQRKAIQDQIDRIEGQAIGVVVTGDGPGTLTAQLMDAERQSTECVATRDQCCSRLKHTDAVLKDRQATMASCAPHYQELAAERSILQNTIDTDSATIAERNPDRLSSRLRELDGEIAHKDARVQQLRDEVATLKSRTSKFDFQFSLQEGRIGRSAVKGRVAKLIKLSDPTFAEALEVVAGGRLYNVVVDKHTTGSALLSKGVLKSRVTIIPLNKIQHSVIPDAVQKRAVHLVGEDNVWPALSLVCYNDEVADAIKYVFGGSFVCRDAESAKAVTFDGAILKRSVTLMGDLLDPQGTLSGGSRPQSQSSLATLQKLFTAETELETVESELNALHAQRSDVKCECDVVRTLLQSNELNLKRLELLNARIEQSESHKLQLEIDSLIEQQAVLKDEIVAAEANIRRCAESTATLRESISASGGGKRGSSANAPDPDNIATLTRDLGLVNSELTKVQQKCHRAELEAAAQSQEIESLMKSVESSTDKIERLESKVAECKQEVLAIKNSHDDAARRLEQERQKLVAMGAVSRQLATRHERLSHTAHDLSLDLKTINHKIGRFAQEKESARQQVKASLEQNEWIAQEKHLFGRPNTPYDFAAQPPSRDATTLAELKKTQAETGKKINRKVMGLMNSAEAQYQALLDRRSIVQKDKARIEQVIENLDRNKNEVLQNIWGKVNRDFGSIFSMLLPGAFAKLEPPVGGTVLDGLEVRVSFGGIWKESLTELSGGQRSLLALSLILSLLLYKPAPMYILDEVDAALDLSHTQNIGQMLATHFSKSQFIVVSLKEGMFNNANVIFKTRFVDGTSTVSMVKNS